MLITIIDTRWGKNIRKGLIASIEVDMTSNKGIFYCSPDFMLTVKDFIKYLKIGIQTKGYEEFAQGTESSVSTTIRIL